MNKHYIHFYSSKCSYTFGNGQEICISPKPFEARALEARQSSLIWQFKNCVCCSESSSQHFASMPIIYITKEFNIFKFVFITQTLTWDDILAIRAQFWIPLAFKLCMIAKRKAHIQSLRKLV